MLWFAAATREGLLLLFLFFLTLAQEKQQCAKCRGEGTQDAAVHFHRLCGSGSQGSLFIHNFFQRHFLSQRFCLRVLLTVLNGCAGGVHFAGFTANVARQGNIRIPDVGKLRAGGNAACQRNLLVRNVGGLCVRVNAARQRNILVRDIGKLRISIGIFRRIRAAGIAGITVADGSRGPIGSWFRGKKHNLYW